MWYISNCKLKFIIENSIKSALFSLNSAQLQGHFKSEYYSLGYIEALQELSNSLNLKIDVDKLKI